MPSGMRTARGTSFRLDGFFRRDKTGLVYYGSQPTTPFEQQLVPYRILNFPLVLGVLLTLLGLATCIKSMLIKGERVESMRFRPLLLILGSVGIFAIAIEDGGIIVATVLSVAVAAAASPDSRTREVIILVIVLLALSVGVFTYGLGLPFKLMPG